MAKNTYFYHNGTEVLSIIYLGGKNMKYMEKDKEKLLLMIGKNVNYYRFHCNNKKIMNEKGFVTIERLAEEIGSSPNMIYNLTAKSVKQGVSIVFIDKIAKVLDVSLSCFFLKEPILNPPKY